MRRQSEETETGLLQGQGTTWVIALDKRGVEDRKQSPAHGGPL